MVAPILRRIALAALGAALVSTARPPVASAGRGSTHPYFDDRGTLAWFADVAAAQRGARESSRAIFVEFGRRACGNCRALVANVMPSPEVAPRLSAALVGLVAEADAPDPRVAAVLYEHLAGATMLPFVGIVTPDLCWITGWSGAAGVAEVARAVGDAEAYLRRCEGATTSATGPGRDCPCATEPARTAPPAPTTPPVAPPLTEPATLPAGADPDAPAVPPPPPSPLPTAAEGPEALRAAAEGAAASARWGDVIRVAREAARLPRGADPTATARIQILVSRARAWREETLDAAVRHARERRQDEARALLDRVESTMDNLPAAQGAQDGREALKRLAEIDRVRADRPAAETLRRAAAARFAGTRWSVLFASL
jgi:hypothetical protein